MSARRVATFMAALGALVMSSGVALMVTATPANAAKIHKSYVCKWVKAPGEETETLQTGQNPIWVDNHALLGHDGETFLGEEFTDGQIRSVVIVPNTAKLKPEPGIEACQGTPPPGASQASASVSFTDPTCEAPNSGSITSSTDEASLAITPNKSAYSVGDTVQVTATANAGAVFDDGAQTSWSHTFVSSNGDACTKVETTTQVSPPKQHTTKTKSHATVKTPTVVEAGLAGATVEDMRGEQGLALTFAGMVMLVAAGGLGLRLRGSASRI